MRKYKIVKYVDKETSTETQISSRRRSLRTTPARLRRACTAEKRNTNLEKLALTKTRDADDDTLVPAQAIEQGC